MRINHMKNNQKTIFRDIDEARRKLNRQKNNLVHAGIIVLPNMVYDINSSVHARVKCNAANRKMVPRKYFAKYRCYRRELTVDRSPPNVEMGFGERVRINVPSNSLISVFFSTVSLVGLVHLAPSYMQILSEQNQKLQVNIIKGGTNSLFPYLLNYF